MNLIKKQLGKIKEEKRVGLMTHVVVGYPTIEDTVGIVRSMISNGVDFVELQIPFSDPLADGSTIMRACEKSLENGTRVGDSFTVMKSLSIEVDIPLLFMGYYNTVFRYGVERFCKDASEAGASGLIIPDMPLDEEGEEHFFAACRKNELYAIQVISPVSTDERLKKNAESAEGFIYCAARQGTTGVTDTLDPGLARYLKKVRKYFDVPAAVGFGISKSEHVSMIEPYADIVIVGSALIEVINRSGKKDLEKNVGRFVRELKGM